MRRPLNVDIMRLFDRKVWKQLWTVLVTFSLYYKLDILRLFYKANNDSLPEPLMKSILENSSHGYSLRGKELSSIPRFNSRFMKDSFRYKGSVLWNIVLYHEQYKSFSSFFDLRKHVVRIGPILKILTLTPCRLRQPATDIVTLYTISFS